MHNLVLFLALSISSVWAAPMCSLRAASKSPSSASPTGGIDNGNGKGGGGGGGGSTNNTLPTDVVATTWYAGWHASKFPLNKVSWKKYTSVTYAFAYVPAFPLFFRSICLPCSLVGDTTPVSQHQIRPPFPFQMPPTRRCFLSSFRLLIRM